MSLPKAHLVRVFCDAESHSPKVPTVGRPLKAGGNGYAYDVRQDQEREYLLDDEIVGPRDAFGTATRGPTPGYAGTRERRVLLCPLCDLRVELRADKERALVEGLAAAGVSQVRLSALAASL